MVLDGLLMKGLTSCFAFWAVDFCIFHLIVIETCTSSCVGRVLFLLLDGFLLLLAMGRHTDMIGVILRPLGLASSYSGTIQSPIEVRDLMCSDESFIFMAC
jgi:hypothetical protein